MKTEDEVVHPPSLSSTVRGDSSTTIRGCVKKEEEEKIRISNRRHHGDDNNNNNNSMDGSDMNHDDLNRVRLQAVKKEEEEEENDDDDDHHENNETHDNYDDWGKGNWCWLLPAKANANIYDKTRRCKSSVTHSIKSKDGDKNNDTTRATNTGITAAATSTNKCRNARGIVTGRRSMPRDDGNDNNNDDDDDEKKPPGKKMRHCRPINDVIKEEVQEEEEGEDSTYETNNITTNDNDNDNGSTSINSNTEGDDEEGYESWTEGNWCWVIPFPPAVLGKIETTGPSTTTTTTTTTRRRRRVVRNRNSSHQKSYEEDGSKCNNEDVNTADNDDGGDVSIAKSKSRKGKIMRYTKWQNELWDKMFQRLVAYKKERKSTNVPQKYTEDPKLAKWVQTQRTTYTNQELPVERIRRLDSIGFVWKINDPVPWEEMYQRLIAYKNQHKSSTVPQKYAADLKLGDWVSRQRRYYINKTLSTERTNLLESIGFVWDAFDSKWMEMYSKLVEYKKQNKTTRVPYYYTDDPSFGMWVSTQRFVYKQGKLSGRRLKLLNSINFVWVG